MNLRKFKVFRSLFGLRYTVADLKIQTATPQIRDWRNRAHIAIIDDQGVPETLMVSLRSKGFRIDSLTDVENVEQLSSYHVIISDVDGVAKIISPTHQGIGLITELSKLYPQKSLAIYSGITHKLSDLPYGVLVINKDDDVDVWTSKIDHLVEKVSNPINIWRIIASRLISSDIPTTTIAKIEDDFVYRSVNKLPFEGFPRETTGISAELQKSIFSLVADSIFYLVTK